MNDLVSIADEIQNDIKELFTHRNKLKTYADKKALTLAEYDKQIAVTIIKLKNGVEFELDGAIIKEPVNTIIEKIARGICYQAKLEMETADAEYKALITAIDCIQAGLNGRQSLFRWLDK